MDWKDHGILDIGGGGGSPPKKYPHEKATKK